MLHATRWISSKDIVQSLFEKIVSYAKPQPKFLLALVSPILFMLRKNELHQSQLNPASDRP